METQSVQFTQSCLTLHDPMDCIMPGLSLHHQFPKLAQTHVHWVGDSIQPSHPLLSPFPPALNLSQNRGLFKWVSSSHQVAKVRSHGPPVKRAHAAAAAKSLLSCPTLCDPIDGSPPGPAIPGILQARTLEWVAISFSNAWKWKVKVKSLSCVRILATHGLQPTRLLHPWDFPGKGTGVGCHCLGNKQGHLGGGMGAWKGIEGFWEILFSLAVGDWSSGNLYLKTSKN